MRDCIGNVVFIKVFVHVQQKAEQRFLLVTYFFDLEPVGLSLFLDANIVQRIHDTLGEVFNVCHCLFKICQCRFIQRLEWWTRQPANLLFKAVHDVIKYLVIVRLVSNVTTHFSEGVVYNGQKNIDKDQKHKEHVRDEKDGSDESV